ncbi:hypothetical protein [Pseudoalteromonas luteoviolacea]|nr:hypothetical protein [Pseudoalteromonas luteoviolacea]
MGGQFPKVLHAKSVLTNYARKTRQYTQHIGDGEALPARFRRFVV